MTQLESPQPFVKWAGGKRQLLPDLASHLPSSYGTYFEPFVGGGALLFDLHPSRAVVSDANAELINAYLVIRDCIEELLESLARHRNEEAYYYVVRAWDRSPDYHALSPVERASRLLFLNRTCYNGLYRVNKEGQFNVPFGKYKNPNLVPEDTLRAVHHYLATRDIRILAGDFAVTVADAKSGDFVYFDPPYDPLSTTSSFTGYQQGGFGQSEQERLKQMVDELTERGCYVMVSNSATPFIRALYRDYPVRTVSAARNINSKGLSRGHVDEVLIMNYDPHTTRLEATP